MFVLLIPAATRVLWLQNQLKISSDAGMRVKLNSSRNVDHLSPLPCCRNMHFNARPSSAPEHKGRSLSLRDTQRENTRLSHFGDSHKYCFLISTCLLSTTAAEVQKTLWTCFNLLKSSSPRLTALHPVLTQTMQKKTNRSFCRRALSLTSLFVEHSVI